MGFTKGSFLASEMELALKAFIASKMNLSESCFLVSKIAFSFIASKMDILRDDS